MKWIMALAGMLVLAGCGSPLYEARQFLQSEAGQKLVDKMEVSGELENPCVEVYGISGFGMRAIGVTTTARWSGEVSDDERGFGPALADTQPAKGDDDEREPGG